MNYIKLFEDFNKETEGRLNDLLDKIGRGEELTQHEKDTLSSISSSEKAKSVHDEVMDWLNKNYGHLESDIDTYKSFGKEKTQKVLYDKDTTESYVQVEMNQNRIAYVDYDIFKKLYSYYNLSESEASVILCTWLQKTYEITVENVNPSFKNEF